MTEHQEANTNKRDNSRSPDNDERSDLKRHSMPATGRCARFLPRGIRERLFLLIALALLPVLLLQGWIYYQNYQERQSQALHIELQIAQGTATTFSTYVNGVRSQLNTLGEAILTFSPYTQAKAERLLKTMADRYPAVHSVNWVSPEGMILASNLPEGAGRSLSAEPCFQKIMAGRPWDIGDLAPQGAIVDRPTVALCVAIRDDSGALRGLVAAELEPTRLDELTFARQQYTGSAWVLFDRQGRLVYRDPEVPLTWNQRTQARQADPLLQQALKGQTALGEITSVVAGDHRLAARLPIADIGWVAGAARPVRLAMAPVWRGLFEDAGLGLLVTLLAFTLAYLIARTLARPLHRLERDAQAMSAGKIEESADPQAPTEVRHLRDAVAQMATDLIRRAEALRERENELRLIMNAAPALISYVDSDYRYRRVNEGYERWFGRAIEEIQDRHVQDVLGLELWQAVRPYMERALAGEIVSFEHEVLLPGGGSRWVHVSYMPDRDESDRVRGFVTHVMDIGDRKKAEDELRRVALFPAQNPSPILRVAADGTLLYANDASVDLLRLWDCAPGGPVPGEIRRRVVQTLDSGKVTEEDVVCGSVTYSFSMTPISSENYVNLYARDITERQRAEEALRQSESFYRQTLESIPGMVFTTRPDGYCDYQSQQWVDYTGVPMSEHLGNGWNKLLHPEDRPRAFAAWRDAVEGRAPYDLEYRVRRHDGRYEWFKVIGRPIRDATGQIVRWFGVALNIEALKRAEEVLHESTKTLESKVAQRTKELEHRARQLQKLTLELSEAEDRERRRLAEILHDDLQQQLAAAKFHLGLLSNRVRGDTFLRKAMVRLDELIGDAIERSRSLSHELSPALMHHGDLGEVFRWLAGEVHAKHGLLVHVRTDGEVKVQSDAMKALLYRAAQEMLFNVIKHARTNEARIRLRDVNGFVCLSVSDRGRGFDPQEIKTTTGFGLLSIRERVQFLGGRMRIRSAKGRGSTFFIAVPDGQGAEEREQTTVGPGPRADSTPGNHGGSPVRVLLVDDHEIVREGLTSLLNEALDIQVVGEAANGREAVDLAYQLRPDVVVMDVSLPLINGDEATRQILNHLPGTRVIALSMYEEADTVARMHRAGAEAYLLKTAPSDELLAAIRNKVH